MTWGGCVQWERGQELVLELLVPADVGDDDQPDDGPPQPPPRATMDLFRRLQARTGPLRRRDAALLRWPDAARDAARDAAVGGWVARGGLGHDAWRDAGVTQ